MISDRSLYLAAQAMIRRFGPDAESRAAWRANQCMDEGDVLACQAWLQVLGAVRVLRREAPQDDESVH